MQYEGRAASREPVSMSRHHQHHLHHLTGEEESEGFLSASSSSVASSAAAGSSLGAGTGLADMEGLMSSFKLMANTPTELETRWQEVLLLSLRLTETSRQAMVRELSTTEHRQALADANLLHSLLTARAGILVCYHCGTTATPQWRTGPTGPNQLCNACGLRYAKELKAQGKSLPKVEGTEAGLFGGRRKSSSKRERTEFQWTRTPLRDIPVSHSAHEEPEETWTDADSRHEQLHCRPIFEQERHMDASVSSPSAYHGTELMHHDLPTANKNDINNSNVNKGTRNRAIRGKKRTAFTYSFPIDFEREMQKEREKKEGEEDEMAVANEEETEDDEPSLEVKTTKKQSHRNKKKADKKQAKHKKQDKRTSSPEKSPSPEQPHFFTSSSFQPIHNSSSEAQEHNKDDEGDELVIKEDKNDRQTSPSTPSGSPTKLNLSFVLN
ncbi:GATA-type domain-containing protein [Balamuthia mandrillaris]